MKGAVVDRRVIVYILLVVAVVNLVAYAKVQDGQALIFFALAFGVVYSFEKNVMMALIAAIVGTSLFRAVVIMREGMDSKGPDTPAPKSKTDPLKALGTSGVQGMKSLMKQQEGLMQMAQNLQPLMQQASKLLEGLPDGVLEQAMNKLKKP